MNQFISFLQLSCDVGVIITSILEMRTLRHGGVESLSQVMLTTMSEATLCHSPRASALSFQCTWVHGEGGWINFNDDHIWPNPFFFFLIQRLYLARLGDPWSFTGDELTTATPYSLLPVHGIPSSQTFVCLGLKSKANIHNLDCVCVHRVQRELENRQKREVKFWQLFQNVQYISDVQSMCPWHHWNPLP